MTTQGGANTNKLDVTVAYKFVDGAHFFTSTHPLARGLCAASTDLKEAYDDVPNQMKTLLKKNHNDSDCVVAHAVPFNEFLQQLMAAVQSALKARGRSDNVHRFGGVRPPPSALIIKVSELEAA